MSNELKTQDKPTDLKGWLNHDSLRSQIAAALPKHMTAERFCRIAITALSKTPKLAECSQASFFKCVLDLSAIGLEPDGRKAHLIPRGKECTLLVDYKGLVELVRRDPSVLDVQCLTVCENDKFVWRNGEVEHEINPLVDRGEVIATYTRIKWANGNVSCGEPFSKKDAEKARASSACKDSGPWKDHYVEMWRKSNIRRDSKMWPLASEVAEAIAKEDEHNNGMRNVTRQAPTFALPKAEETKSQVEVEVATQTSTVELTPEEAWGE